MEWVKTTAKTLPEAIDLALDNLGVDEAEAEIVIVEEPRPGLFGRMRGNARVEARVKPKPIRPKNERNRNRRGRGDGKGKGRGDGKGGDRNRNRDRNRSKNRSGEGRGNNDGGGDGRNKSQGGNRGKGRGGQDDKARDEAKTRDAKHGESKGQSSKSNESHGQGGNKQGGGRSGRGQDRSAGREGNRHSEARNTNKEQGQKPMEESSVDEVAEHLENFLTELTEAFGFDGDVTLDRSEQDTLVGSIEGQHGLLVGPKGRTLDAVQELARISCQRAVPSSIRIKVDVGGYREKRVAALGQFARSAADRAAEEGSEVALEPMTPADRKAVHDALNEDDRVETRSVGTEPRRRVIIVPLDVDEADEDGDDVDDTNEDAESMNGDHADEAVADAVE